MAQYVAPTFDVNLDPVGVVIDLTSLYAAFARLTEHWDVRGIRYGLPTLLTFITLAKLAGENSLSGIAEWVKYRVDELSTALALQKKRAPVDTNYSRALAKAIAVNEFERVVHNFFANQAHNGQSVHVILDGEAARGDDLELDLEAGDRAAVLDDLHAIYDANGPAEATPLGEAGGQEAGGANVRSLHRLQRGWAEDAHAASTVIAPSNASE